MGLNSGARGDLSVAFEYQHSLMGFIDLEAF